MSWKKHWVGVQTTVYRIWYAHHAFPIAIQKGSLFRLWYKFHAHTQWFLNFNGRDYRVYWTRTQWFLNSNCRIQWAGLCLHHVSTYMCLVVPHKFIASLRDRLIRSQTLGCSRWQWHGNDGCVPPADSRDSARLKLVGVKAKENGKIFFLGIEIPRCPSIWC
jgi:hypothetical protein